MINKFKNITLNKQINEKPINILSTSYWYQLLCSCITTRQCANCDGLCWMEMWSSATLAHRINDSERPPKYLLQVITSAIPAAVPTSVQIHW